MKQALLVASIRKSSSRRLSSDFAFDSARPIVPWSVCISRNSLLDCVNYSMKFVNCCGCVQNSSRTCIGEPRGPADQLGTDIISQTPNDLVTATRVSMEAEKRVAS